MVVLGLDYGIKRIGLAVSDSTGTLATAIGSHEDQRDGSILSRITGLIEERGVAALVVGLPLTADGREGDIALRARAFAERLREAFALPVHMVDERYSSSEADRWLRAGGRRRHRKGERDAVAAELIRQQFLDSKASGSGEVGP